MSDHNTFQYFRIVPADDVNVPVSVLVFHTALNPRLKLLLTLGKEIFYARNFASRFIYGYFTSINLLYQKHYCSKVRGQFLLVLFGSMTNFIQDTLN